jgi:hypothetical protein
MQEVLPGSYHWATVHPKIHVKVSSWWLEDSGVIVDPLVPEDVGLEWFGSRTVRPTAVLLSNRHHYRDAGRFADVYGCPVYCNRAGLHEFTHGESVEGFDLANELPGGVIACEVDALCPDETALHLPQQRAIIFADGVVRGGPYGGDASLGFVPDSLMDEPEATKRRLLDAFERLLEELDFDHVLLAHGGPAIGNGRGRLRELVDSGGRTAFEL